MRLKNLVFPILVVSAFFAAPLVRAGAVGVRPLFLTEDRMAGFAETVPRFIETT
jgi:hypothetical protein